MDANELVLKEVMDMSDEVARFVVACLTENGKLMQHLSNAPTNNDIYKKGGKV